MPSVFTKRFTAPFLIAVLLTLTAPILKAQELAPPPETSREYLSDLMKQLSSRMHYEALPLLDSRISPVRKEGVDPREVASGITGEMIESLENYYNGLTNPQPYLIDTVNYLTAAWQAGEFILHAVPPSTYLEHSQIFIENKFLPQEGGKIVISQDLVERFQESPESTIGFLVQLSKHYYDHHHNSIDFFFCRRNIREEFLYLRDALFLQLEVVEPLLDVPDNRLTDLERFYMDSRFRDQLSSVFMLQMGLEQDFFFFLKDQTDRVIANPQEVLLYLQGLRRMYGNLSELTAPPSDPFQTMILGQKLTSFWIFQGWFFMEMAQRVPIYTTPESRAESRAVIQEWLTLGDRIQPLQENLFQGRENFITQFYVEREIDE